MGGWGATALLLCLALGPAAGQRSNALIQSLVSRLKNSPQHYSISPSYSSQRRQEVLAVHSLPLQTESGAAPSITDVITGNLGKFETSETNEVKARPEASDSLSLGSQQRPVKKPRRRRPGKVGARPVRLSRPGGPRPPLDRKERPRPSRRIKERNRVEQQVAVEEFFPPKEEEDFYLRPERPSRPGRRGPMRPDYPSGPKRNPRKGPRPPKKDVRHHKKELRPHNKDSRPSKKDLRPKRQKPRPPSSPSLRPGPPRHKRKPQGPPAPRPSRGYPRKPTSFRPPKTVYKGFAPTLQSSAPYDDSPLYLDDPVSKPKRPKRRRRPKPVTPEQEVEVAEIPDLRPFTDEAPSIRPRRPASHSGAPTDFNPFDKPKSVINFSTKSPMSINMPGPPYEADSQRLSPFSDEEPRFPSSSRRPDRPKRQKAAQQYRPLQQGPQADAQYNEVVTDGTQDNIGFFNNVQENFPDIESFGIGWESSKIRRKRSAQRSILRHVPPSKSRRARRGPRPASRGPQRQAPTRRQGPAGFWDDAEFDAEFFNGGAPPSYNSFESFSQNRFQTPRPPPQANRRPVRRPNFSPKKYETSQKYPERTPNYPGRFSSSYQEEAPQYQETPQYPETPRRYPEAPHFPSPEDNAILGSGNFEILKGGTFYDENDFRTSQYSNNRAPSNGYGQNDIFHNFRDFADIKGERKQQAGRGRYQSYYQ